VTAGQPAFDKVLESVYKSSSKVRFRGGYNILIKGKRDGTKAVCTKPAKGKTKKKWQKPKLEDVSSKVMAQPYIRFT
jgi:hypothetical protein